MFKMEPQQVSVIIDLIRSTLSAWLFMIAGVILVISRSRWMGSWVLLIGAIILSAITGIQLIGVAPKDANVWILLAFEAGNTLGYVLTGIGAVLVSMQARKGAA
jgi:hypothetical protein